jgi:asparagine synthase (glutamine-hydrolysing)
MCAIAGIYGVVGICNRRNVLADMLLSMRHRGPDDSGTFFSEPNNLCLGHNRLSIVDVDGAKQPMRSTTGRTIISFNGEIYGYKKHRSILRAGYTFQSNSDTEVILAKYEKEGEEFIHGLNGMFALAIWDESQKKLILARDRYGEKPLYYAVTKSGAIIFSSELKGILGSKLINPQLDRESVAHYLRFSYVNPLKTIYSNIHVVAPGHYLTVNGNGKINTVQYWSSSKIQPNEEKDIEGKFKHLFSEAIKSQLVADVPVACFLSGGMDSTTVVSESAKYNQELTTYNFDIGGVNSEGIYALAAANLYGTKHETIEFGINNLPNLILKMADIYDEPFCDSSSIFTYLISRQVSMRHKVVLSGDGADELLGGYDFWYEPLLGGKASYITKLMGGKVDYLSRYARKTPVFNNQEIFKLMGENFSKLKYEHPSIGSDPFTINSALELDLNNYLPGDILVKTDRASMENSLEIRTPFLDVDFSTFCLSLTSEQKFEKGVSKKILKQTYSQDWPAIIRNRDKMGFGADVSSWLNKIEMTDLINYYINDKSRKIYSIINYDVARKLVNNKNYKMWSILNLSIWADKYL